MVNIILIDKRKTKKIRNCHKRNKKLKGNNNITVSFSIGIFQQNRKEKIRSLALRCQLSARKFQLLQNLLRFIQNFENSGFLVFGPSNKSTRLK